METNQIIEAAYAARAEYTHDMARSFAKRIALPVCPQARCERPAAPHASPRCLIQPLRLFP